MCSSRNNKVESRAYSSWSRSADEADRSGRWTGANIFAMVIGFVFFWPVGLVILYWIYSGRNVQDLPAAVREKWGRLFRGSRSVSVGDSDNVVFNDYQQTQYDRIREIKEEIASRRQRFSDFRMDAKRRADQEEFDRFMANGSKAGASES